MNKRLLSLLLVMAMLLTLTACGGGTEETPEEDAVVEEETTEITPEDEIVTDAEEVDPEESQPEQPENVPANPEETPEAQNVPVKPEEAKPEVKPVQKPVENVPAETVKPDGSQSEMQKSVDLTAFYESLPDENWPAMGLMEGEALDAFYPGLAAIAMNQCGVYMPMMSSVVCEIALVEVQSAADVQAVKDIFQARINYQVGDETNPGGAWYPESIEGWKNDSKIVSNGNYVMMIAFENSANVVAAFNALFAS